MIAPRIRTIFPLATTVATLALLAGAPLAAATPIANKFTLSAQFGWEVNKTTGGDICTVASKDECQFLRGSGEPGGFNYPESVAVNNDKASADYSDVYVADLNNDRVQEFTATGEFVSMFGWNVNKTKIEKGAPQAERNVCTASEVAAGAKCQVGEGGGLAGQMVPQSIAVDPDTGDVYVLNEADYRVEEFTATGEFVVMVGGEVNETKDKTAGATEAEKNLCTESEMKTSGVTCKTGVPAPEGSAPHGAFRTAQNVGNLLTVGGPEDLLYVGDEHRVQELDAEGAWKGEISLTSISAQPGSAVSALAVDEAGDVYLAYRNAPDYETDIVREFNPNGIQQMQFEASPMEDAEKFKVVALAFDPYGRLAVAKNEVVLNHSYENEYFSRGAIYSASGTKISEFEHSSGALAAPFAGGIAFASSDQLYVAGENTQEIEIYIPALFPETVTCPATDVAATSATLCGEINANGLFTRGFFDYTPPGGSETPVVFEGDGSAFEPVSAQLTGLEPNETYQYQVRAEAELAGEEVKGSGEELSFHTATPPPVIEGEPSASFVQAQSAVLEASLNPEHAPTSYHFEYRACSASGACGSAQATPAEASSQYGSVGFAQEVRGLAPASTYRYRLVADNEHEEAGKPQGGEATGAEGSFTTGPAPAVQASTGAASAVTATSAAIAGTVDPDGQPATYEFELGLYNGAGTQYGVLISGPAGAGTTSVEQQFTVTGLQPGRTYAYRIKVMSGYGIATGATLLFTTAGRPEVLSVPAPLIQLSIPAIAFPTEAAVSASAKKTAKKTAAKCAKGRKRSSHGKCVAVKKRTRKAKRSSRSQKSERKS